MNQRAVIGTVRAGVLQRVFARHYDPQFLPVLLTCGARRTLMQLQS